MKKRSSLLRQLYRRTFKHYGPLNWWPGETPFEVMVGAILTQNTAWTNVEKAIRNLKRHHLLNPQKLLKLPPKTLARLIRPAGYFNVKTKRLRHFLQFLMAEYGGNISRMRCRPTAELREKLLAVNGIGPETADSILLYALGKPVFVIDAYTQRILSRHYLIKKETSYEALQDFFVRRFKPDVSFYNEYHAQLVNVGKDFCRKKPRCDQCPLNGLNW